MARVSPALLAAVAAGRTVLAPNAELAAALFDAIERVHRDAGDEVWPTPKVRDYSSWLREQHRAAAARRCHRAAPVQRGGRARALARGHRHGGQIGRDFLDPAGAARAARRARRTLFEYAIPHAALDAAHSEECAAFLEWNRAFERRCRAWAASARISLLAGPAAPSAAIDWIESPQWRPAARRWMEQHARVLLPQRTAHSPSRRWSGRRRRQRSSPPWRIGRGSIWPEKGFAPGSAFRI